MTRRSISLFSAALAALLWANVVVATSNSVQDQTSTTRPKSVVVDTKLSEAWGLVEEFGFSISNFQLDHQGEKNTLNIIIRYRYRPNLTRAEYPDFTLIAKDIENLLGHYPDKSDYWELVNNRLTQMILQKYPVLAEITSQIEVSPTPSVRYPRMSIVTRRQPATKGRARK